MKVSIIIPTKNRSEHLENCLRSIISVDKNYDEIIVVDGSTDINEQKKTEKIVNDFGGKYYIEPKNGVSVARNTGIKKSSGDILVFGDDDFIVDKDWIKNLVENYLNREVMCCTGRMLTYRNDEISEVIEKTMSFDRGDKRRFFTKKDISIIRLLRTITLIGNKRLYNKTPVPWAIGYGFNSFKREIFNKIGYFDENLGVGTSSLGGEELDIFYRILKGGYSIAYEPKAIIFHNHRQTFDGALKAAYYAGASIKSFTSKYYHKDMYLLLCFFGTIFLDIFAYIKVALGSEKSLKKMIMQEFKGLFHNPLKR